MVKEKITILNIIYGCLNFFIVICLIFFIILPIYYIFNNITNKFDIILFLIMIIFSIFEIYLARGFFDFFCKHIIPSKYCMKYIKKYINKKELKEILNKEIFEKISINKNKSNLFDFYASNNWIYINRLYIPKAMILNVYTYNNLIYIHLLNNKKDTIINYTMKDNSEFCNKLTLSKIIPNIYFSKNVIPYNEFEKKYIKKFLNEIVNKEDFLNLIKKNYFFTKKELERDFLKENLIKEKKGYFKGDDGKLYEKHINSLGEIFIYEVDNYSKRENNTYFNNEK